MTLKITNYKFLTLSLFIFILLSCESKHSKTEKNKVWEKFKISINQTDINYLLENSLDSIECVDCVNDTNKEIYSSSIIFKENLKNLYNSENLNDRNYATHQTDSIIRIIYSFNKAISSESYNIIYTFKKAEKKYLFTGMITVP